MTKLGDVKTRKWLLLALMLPTIWCCEAEVVKLAEDGKALADIVIASQADVAAQFAALDLKWHLDQMTGGDFKIVADAEADAASYHICVGESTLTRTKRDDLGSQEFVVDIGKDVAEFVGLDETDKRQVTFWFDNEKGWQGKNWPHLYHAIGTTYAVYDFLENDCGVVWADPTDFGTVIPSRPTLTVTNRTERSRPLINYRGGSPFAPDGSGYGGGLWKPGTPGFKAYESLAFSRKENRSRQCQLFLLRQRAGGDFCEANHSFYHWYDRFWIEKSKVFEGKRPDFFAKGYPPDVKPPQLCYLNPDVIAETIREARMYFDNKGVVTNCLGRRIGYGGAGNAFGLPRWGKNYYCIEAMDAGGYCTCERCGGKWRRPERKGESGEWSDYWFAFVNAVAREIKKSHPDKFITTLAYGDGRRAVPSFPLEDNVIVFFCIDASRFTGGERLAKQLGEMQRWHDAYPKRRLGMWLYNASTWETANRSNCQCFYPGFAHELERQFRHYEEINATAGIYNCGFQGDPENYLALKYMFGSKKSADKLLDEYFKMYGAAAKPLRRYYDICEERWSKHRKGSGVQLSWGALGTGGVMAELKSCMDDAERVASTPQEKGALALWKNWMWDYMVAGRETFVQRQSTPQPAWTAKRVPAGAHGDIAKAPWDEMTKVVAPFYKAGTDKVFTNCTFGARLGHDGEYFYLELDQIGGDTEKLVNGPIIYCYDVWEPVFALQRGSPHRKYASSPDGRIVGSSFGEVNFRWNVPSSESHNHIAYFARVESATVSKTFWRTRYSMPLKDMLDRPLKPGDTFYMNPIRTFGGPSVCVPDRWGILCVNPYTSCHTTDRMASVLLEKGEPSRRLPIVGKQDLARRQPWNRGAPRFNGASRYGATPGREFLFAFPVCGSREKLMFSLVAGELPSGVELDAETGVLSGRATRAGEYPFTVRAENAEGSAVRPFVLVIGDRARAQTPLMGWTSWNAFSFYPTQARIAAVAKAMVEKGYAARGYAYVNVDSCWQGCRNGRGTDALQPNATIFPDMGGLVREIHALGLKAGIYTTPMVIAWGSDLRHCPYLPGSTGFPVDPDYAKGGWGCGKKSYIGVDAKQFATWGMDYLKYDWPLCDLHHTREAREALDATGRDFQLCITTDAKIEFASEYVKSAQLVRSSGDTFDEWQILRDKCIPAAARWAGKCGRGCWYDLDMLALGPISRVHCDLHDLKPEDVPPNRLTREEQITHFALWAVLPTPLQLSWDLTQPADEFLDDLVCHEELIAVNQDSASRSSIVEKPVAGIEVWSRELSDGSTVRAFVNLKDETVTLEYPLAEVACVRDVLAGKALGESDALSIELVPHATRVLRFNKVCNQ